MKKDRIENGDFVNIFYLNDEEISTALVIATPCNPGEMFIVRRTDGILAYINTNCSALISIIKIGE